MKIFKFGGASVKDADAFRNLAHIVQEHGGNKRLLIVVSAMGKTTNALELVFNEAYQSLDYSQSLRTLHLYHTDITRELFSGKDHQVHAQLEHLFEQLQNSLHEIKQISDYDQAYDQIVSYGELLSSTILHYYLQQQNLKNQLVDSKKYILTDNSWREAKVDWAWTERMIKRDLPALLEKQLIVTQGFLGGTNNGYTTTLGREGSDFSAAIFAYCLEAEAMYIWKDVEGLLNADPKHFENTVRYPEISYQETIEMAYYGATVIHPKTIKPLANKLIPLYVKSFLNPAGEGTKICDCKFEIIAPAFIRKEHQCLISFSAKDFTFITEKNLGTIFNALSELRIKINMMQNSAISFSICTDVNQDRLQQLLLTLQDTFTIHYNTELTLTTIKNYNSSDIAKIIQGKEILLEQRTRTTFQVVSR